MEEIKWVLTNEEQKLIDKIVDREICLLSVFAVANKRDKTKMKMDLVACHCNGTKLDLKKLLEASDYDFTHDIIGISLNIDRRNGKLIPSFVLRCLANEEKEIKK